MSTFGTVHLKEGNFFVEVAGEQERIPVKDADVERMRELVGKKVEVLHSKPFIAGLVYREPKLGKIINILCNLPALGLQTVVFEEGARTEIARQMLGGKQLSQETFEKISAPSVTEKQ